MTTDKRRHSRIDSLNMIHYECLDKNDSVARQGMGRTLNVSESGILFETRFTLEIKQMLSLAIGLRDEVVNIKGSAVYSNAGKDGKCKTGIRFFEIPKDALQVLKKHIVVLENKNTKR